jgi:hypothetical protein
LDPQAAQHSIPEDNLLATNNAKEPIKRLPNADTKSENRIVITQCLCDPCPGLYTDTISESLLIECRDPRHSCSDGGPK